MEAIRMIVITLMLTLAAVLMLALVTHAAAWSRRHRVGGLHEATAAGVDRAAGRRQG